jgi:hypothetical protein
MIGSISRCPLHRGIEAERLEIRQRPGHMARPFAGRYFLLLFLSFWS